MSCPIGLIVTGSLQNVDPIHMALPRLVRDAHGAEARGAYTDRQSTAPVTRPIIPARQRGRVDPRTQRDGGSASALWVPEILATYFRKFWPPRRPDLTRPSASRQA